MIRVLRILNRFNLGGPTYNAAYLTRYLPPEFETLLVGGQNDPTEKNSEFIPNELGIKPVILDQMRRKISLRHDISAFLELKKIIEQYRPHIVHTHASKAGALGRMAASALKVPVILHTFHGHVFDSYFSQLKAGLYKNIERRLASVSTGIIAISEAQKYDLSQKYQICNEEKIKVITLGFDLSRFRENQQGKRHEFRKRFNIEDDELAIGIVGRLVPIKNHGLFMEAMAIVQQKTRKKLRAFIIGDGESRKHIEQKARTLELDYLNWHARQGKAFLTLTGWITEMDKVNAGLDVVALTSLNEGTPVSLIEAQAAGRPIVSTNVGGIGNVVLPEKTALLCNTRNPSDFAERILQITENDNLRFELGKEGWKHVEEKFHYKRLVNDMAGYYHELLTKQGHSV